MMMQVRQNKDKPAGCGEITIGRLVFYTNLFMNIAFLS